MKKAAPLAERMRPRNLSEFIGQEKVVGPGSMLRRAIEAGRLPSMILWGPPGSGKTTLARLTAEHTKSRFVQVNAVTSGVAELRRVIEEARERLEFYGERTVVFIDEIHRFNRNQQDALLPAVESGLITLIGATTENPMFEVNAPLISRCRLFQLRPLGKEEIIYLLKRAVADPERGYGRLPVEVAPEALDHWAEACGGDARVALNALELAVAAAGDGAGPVHIGLKEAEEAIQRRALSYDKAHDEHYDTISAFIKSVRGSDPDAALFWLAKMIYAGESHRFIMRRLLILAAEDVGLADPQGIVVASACAQALEWCGMPEGQYHLAMATLYLATAPKSNSVGAYFKAYDDIAKGCPAEVPIHLRDSNRDAARFGHGQNYLYPHDFPDHWVAQAYRPAGAASAKYYQPGALGYEAMIKRWLATLSQNKAPAWPR
ncbi:MAG TPA: replication-associated recombination protein A [Firmicutes bacterium]|nr:replication-associated recombination protein A [Bacillota bacterium]